MNEPGIFEADVLSELYNPELLASTPIYRQLLSEIPQSYLIPHRTTVSINIKWRNA
ncbi:hypothetical protein SEA_NICEHOUSE_235 [Rhodococcus phage NiceHouse]|nr:hypothetical protein SEA_NICEHOUSE_235 [Rhodococcus phage NiceHouse]